MNREELINRRVVQNNPTAILYQVRRLLEGETTRHDFVAWLSERQCEEAKYLDREIEAARKPGKELAYVG